MSLDLICPVEISHLDLEEVDSVLRETLDNIGKKCKNEGIKEGVKNVAIEMIKEGFSLDMIAKITKMPVSEIKSLKV